jgi:TP901 family phage tail tape measure protein
MTVEELVLRINGDSKGAVAATAALRAELAKAKKDLADLTAAAEKFGTVGQKALGTEIEAASQKVSTLEGEIKKLTHGVDGAAPAMKSLATQLREIGTAATRIGAVLSATITAPLVGAAAAALHFGAEFQTEMTKVVTLAGASRAEVDRLEKKVLDLAPAVGVGPAELAKGLFVIESAGFRGAEAMKVLEIAGRMTALGMGTTEETARSLVGVMFTYTSQNISAAEAADILTKTVQLGNMRINELVPALARVNPLAAALGVRFQDVAAGIATFTHMGASSEVAATGMRAMLSNILNDSAKTEKGFKALSLALGDSSISMENFRKEMKEKGFTAAMIDLMAKVNQAGDAGITALNKIFPNIKALTVAMADYIAQGGLVVDIHKQLEESTGTLDKSTAELHKTWQFQFDAMKAQMDKVWIALSQSLIPELEKLVNLLATRVGPGIQSAIDRFNKLPEPVKLAAIVAAALLAALGPVVLIGGQVAMTIAAILPLIGGAAGLSALMTAAGTAIAAVFLPAMAAILVPWALYEIVRVFQEIRGLMQDSKNWKRDMANEKTVTLNTMAVAAKLAGHEFKTLSDATAFLDARAKRLRETTLAGIKAHDEAAAAAAKAGAAHRKTAEEVKAEAAAHKKRRPTRRRSRPLSTESTAPACSIKPTFLPRR